MTIVCPNNIYGIITMNWLLLERQCYLMILVKVTLLIFVKVMSVDVRF